MTGTDNIETVFSLFELMIQGDVDAASAYFTEETKFFTLGDMPFCGWYGRDEFLHQTSYLTLAGPITVRFGEVMADEDRVWLEAESDAELTTGHHYSNVYNFHVKLKDGKVVEFKEFTDTLHIYRVLEGEAVRGTPKPRVSALTTVSRTFTGNSVGEVVRDREANAASPSE